MARGWILILNDAEPERDSMVAALRAVGYHVDVAGSKAEVFGLLDRQAYALILSDLRMRELNGPAFYRALEQRGAGTMPPVIFVMDRPYTPEHAGFLMRRAVPVLIRPFSSAELCAAVDRAVVASGPSLSMTAPRPTTS